MTELPLPLIPAPKNIFLGNKRGIFYQQFITRHASSVFLAKTAGNMPAITALPACFFGDLKQPQSALSTKIHTGRFITSATPNNY
ncbi:MAG: hypothetical protein DU430_04265 [Candidatus Tokpelaia sp.]|nr:MAG: hypothetical protein DU430_04265 [Candidatus Tokpelaia sp.]